MVSSVTLTQLPTAWSVHLSTNNSNPCSLSWYSRKYDLMDVRNVYASGSDTGYEYAWNVNIEANALTDRGVFRIFRDGKTGQNAYRREPAKDWRLRSFLTNSGAFLTVYYDGTIHNNSASTSQLVRPSVTILWMHEMYGHLKVILELMEIILAGIRITK